MQIISKLKSPIIQNPQPGELYVDTKNNIYLCVNTHPGEVFVCLNKAEIASQRTETFIKLSGDVRLYLSDKSMYTIEEVREIATDWEHFCRDKQKPETSFNQWIENYKLP